MEEKLPKDSNTKIQKLYYESKQIRSEIQTRDGLKCGICREWYSNGQLKCEQEYVNNEVNGRWREWYENGQLAWDSIQTNGWPYNGYQRAWTEEGTLELDSTYSRGKLHGILYKRSQNGDETREYWWNGKKQQYDPERADLMIDFLSNLGYEIKCPEPVSIKINL